MSPKSFYRILAACILVIAIIVYGRYFYPSLWENIGKKHLSSNTSVNQISSDSNYKNAPLFELPIFGPINAKLSIDVLSDYACGWSRQYYQDTIKPFVDNYLSKYDVNIKYDMVSYEGSPSLLATEAIHCGVEVYGSEYFWPLHSALFSLAEEGDLETQFSRENIIQIIKEIHVDNSSGDAHIEDFIKCLDSHKYRNYILERFKDYVGAYNNLGFPTTFLNGQPMQMMIEGKMQTVGAVSLEDFIKIIEQKLNL